MMKWLVPRQIFILYLLLLRSFEGLIACHAQDPPVNDQCKDAIGPLSTDGTEVVSTTIGVTTTSREVELFQCGKENQIFDVKTPGVWFLVVGNGGRLRASTCSPVTNFPNRITVFVGEDCDSRGCFDSGVIPDPLCFHTSETGATFGTYLEWSTKMDEPYYILVHNANPESSGDFGISITDITQTPENDHCENAMELEGASSLEGTTVDAFIESTTFVDCNSVKVESPGVWYRMPPVDKMTEAFFSICSETLLFNTSIYSGKDCGKLICHDRGLTVDMEAACGAGASTNSSWLAEEGKEYYILVFASKNNFQLTGAEFTIDFTTSDFGRVGGGDLKEGDSSSNFSDGPDKLLPLFLSVLISAYLLLGF